MARMTAPNVETTVQQLAGSVEVVSDREEEVEISSASSYLAACHKIPVAASLAPAVYVPRPLPTTGRTVDIVTICEGEAKRWC